MGKLNLINILWKESCALAKLAKKKTGQNWPKMRQGRIHGYPSRVRVGRGSDEIDQLDDLAEAVTPKPPVNAEKS